MNRPALLISVVAFVIGVALGWTANGKQFAEFVAGTKAQGQIAEVVNKAIEADDAKNKKEADHDYQTRIADASSAAKRLRNDRAASGILPAAPASSRGAGIACFDQAELERALQQFDGDISGLIGEGDEEAVGLNVARAWAQTRRTVQN